MKLSLNKLSPVILIIIALVNCTNGNAQTKESAPANSDTPKVFQKVEVEASFPGGAVAWNKYISEAIMANSKKFRKSDYGTCIIKFIVDTKGVARDVEATTMKKSRLAKVAIDAIVNGPKWNPAIQDGKNVNAYRLQPITISK